MEYYLYDNEELNTIYNITIRNSFKTNSLNEKYKAYHNNVSYNRIKNGKVTDWIACVQTVSVWMTNFRYFMCTKNVCYSNLKCI